MLIISTLKLNSVLKSNNKKPSSIIKIYYLTQYCILTRFEINPRWKKVREMLKNTVK